MMRMDYDYARACGEGFERTRIGAALGAIGCYPKMWFKALVCLAAGHDKHDFGSAGPESGDIDVRCRRCGRVFARTTLY